MIDKNYNKQVGDFIAQKIAASGMTYAEVADKVGVTEYRLASFIKGTRSPYISIAHNLAKALGFDVNDFMKVGEAE